MSSIYTNKHNVPLALSVWLVADNYDYQDIPNYISATTLLKPLRQMILSARTLPSMLKVQPDVSDLAARAMGNALHDSIEKAWLSNYAKSLKILGYPEDVISSVRINPEPNELFEGCIPIYLEQRQKKQVGKWVVGGKFDMVADGVVHDNKSTTVYAWINGGKDEDYKMQGSIYRWLNPDKITEDFIRVNFIFTDWQRSKAAQDPEYPQARTMCKEFPLLSMEETDAWVRAKLAQIERYVEAPDAEIPHCTDEELWRAPTIYKYYVDPSKTQRATKVIGSDPVEAQRFLMVEKMGKGVVLPTGGEPKRCDYCDAVSHCSQARMYGK